jgi:hypothetical protein
MNTISDIQQVFEKELSEKRLHIDGWHYNASDKAILGYVLMLQTGDLDNPTDKTKVGHFKTSLLLIFMFKSTSFSLRKMYYAYCNYFPPPIFSFTEGCQVAS